MSNKTNKNYHLTPKQLHIIDYELSLGKSPDEIISSWDVAYHQRVAPTKRTINSIIMKRKKKVSIERKKSGQKTRSVLTPQKLDEVENVIIQNKNITYEELSSQTNISKGSAITATKIIGLSQYDAKYETFLTDIHIQQRLTFCLTYLKWNYGYRKRIWWSVESLFSIENISHFGPRHYFATENEQQKIQTKFDKKSFSIWAEIRGDGKLIFEILEGIQKSENYIQVLFNRLEEMEMETSFLMQDGAGIHTSNDALDWINFLWKDRWIGLHSKRLEFPPYSMDLTPMDFSFWSYIKRKVAAYECVSLNELKEKVIEEMKAVPENVFVNM